jgi:hypothetical protein
MRHRLLTLAAAISLLLCIATAALWVRSLQTRDTAIFNPTPPPGETRVQWHLSAAAGQTRVMRVRGPVAFARGANRVWWSEPLDGQPWWFIGTGSKWGLLGASVHNGGTGVDATIGPRTTFRVSYWAVVLPLWLPTLLFAVLPTVWCLRRRRAPAAPNACQACGYDLRATPDRCPECGTIPPVPLRSTP